MRILTVDDSRLMIPYFRDIFMGLENTEWVGHAFTVAEAEELLQSAHPDVVFLDICLKQGKGFDLLKFIKSKYPAVKVLMLSNNKNDFYIRKSREHGALCLIDKTNEFNLIPSFLQALQEAEKKGQRIKYFK